MLSRSEIAANRTTVVWEMEEGKEKERKKRRVETRYMKGSIRSLYCEFKREEKGEISETTFRKLVPKQYKQGKKESDLCDKCEEYKHLKRKYDS